MVDRCISPTEFLRRVEVPTYWFKPPMTHLPEYAIGAMSRQELLDMIWIAQLPFFDQNIHYQFDSYDDQTLAWFAHLAHRHVRNRSQKA